MKKGRKFKKYMTILLCILLLQFAAVEGIIIMNSMQDYNGKCDYLIILGAGVNGSVPSAALYNRLNKGLEYLKSHPGTKVILSGGQGPREDITEAEAMRRYLVENGISGKDMIIEDRSTDTLENIKFSKMIIEKTDNRGTINLAIVTNGFHVFRSLMIARRQGFEAFGLASKTPPSVLLKCYIREYFALIKSFMVDR